MYCELVMKIFGIWVGRRTESDRTADGIRSDGGRSTMTEVEVLGYRGGVMGYIYYVMGLYTQVSDLDFKPFEHTL